MTEKTTAALRVVVVDDQELVRAGFALILQRAGMEVVAEAANGVEAVARVTVRYGPGEMCLEVADDGVGLPGREEPVAEGAAAGAGGHGLVGMRERVRLYDGVLTAAPGADGGYSVTARFPLSHGAR